ncbi:hypothetical protein C0Z20_17130 [Trinickia symbiotica]|uniref:Uncharacterized protein n=1 Tax=Trinickia symbiotica TaxID=863227 RepID=A0A2N7X226_9BURK|nr:hypothetical protein C0Z20_17130 [Trinickia symbiotica]
MAWAAQDDRRSDVTSRVSRIAYRVSRIAYRVSRIAFMTLASTNPPTAQKRACRRVHRRELYQPWREAIRTSARLNTPQGNERAEVPYPLPVGEKAIAIPSMSLVRTGRKRATARCIGRTHFHGTYDWFVAEHTPCRRRPYIMPTQRTDESHCG